MSKVMSKINTAVKDGGETMENFAQVSGMSGQEFATLWENDPYKAIMKFEGGVKEAVDQGENHKTLLKELGITELRETDTVLRLANGNKQLANAREHANKGWKEGTALSDEAEKKYQSLGNQMKLFMNHVRALGIEIGAALTPVLKFMMKALTPVIDALASAPAPIKLLVVALGLIPVIAVPVLASLAAITGAMGLMGQAMNTGAMAAGRNGRALRIYAGTMGLLTSPIATSRKALGLFSGSLAKVGTKSGKTSKALSGMPGVFRSTGKSTKGTTTIFQRLGKVMGALLMPFKLLLSPLKLLKGLMPLLGAGVRTLGLAFRILTGPIGIAVTILTILYKTIKYAYNNVEWFRKGVDGLIYTFKVFGGGIIGTVIDNLKKLGNWFSKTGESIKSKFTKNVQDSYKALDDDDLLKKGVEGFKSVMKTMGTATDKATDSVKVLGKGVSKETKKALGSYIKYSEKSSNIMTSIKNSHNKITDEQSNDLINKNQAMHDALIDQFEKRKNKEIEIAQKSFDEGILTQEQYNAVEQATNEHYEKQKSKSEQYTNDMLEILNRRKDGELSKEDVKEYEELLKKQNELGVRELSKGEKEQGKILRRMSSNRKAMSVEDASEVIKEANKSLKASKKAAQDRLDQRLLEIDEMKGLSESEKEDLVKIAQDQYDTQIKESKDKHKEIKKGVIDNNKDIESEMDTSNGKVYSNAEKWWKKTKEFLADDSLSQGFKKGMEGIGEWFSSQGAEFSKNFKEGWKTATQAGGDLWSWIKQTGSGLGEWFNKKGSEFSSAFKNGWAIASQTGGDLWGWIKQTGAGIGGWFAQQGREFWSALKNGWSNAIAISGDIWSSIKQTGANIGAWFSQKGSQLWGSMKSGWNNAITTTGDLWNSLTTWLGSKWGLTKQWFITKGSNMWSSIKQGWNNLINTDPGALWKTLTTALGTAWAATKQWFITKGKQMGSAISTGWSAMKGFVVSTFSAIWTSVKVIWKGIWSTISYWAGAIWDRVKSVWSWIKTNTVGAFTWVWNKIKSIWKGIKGTITYWTGAIWNRVKGVWNWIKSNTASAFTWVWNKIKSIWKGIKGTITYWTNAIWNKVKSIWNTIKTHTSNIFNAIWNKLKSIWSSIFGTIKYWMNQIWNKVKNGWNSIKKHTVDMVTKAKDAVVDKFTEMYDGAKEWIDKIGSYIDDAKKWMKDKAVSLGTSIANGAISGLNGMIGGINKISKAITSKKLMDEIPELSTGTGRGRPKSNSKGQLKQPTTAVVNDRGRGNGQGRNGHQEVIQKANGSMYAPRGKNVVVGLGKGDIVHSGQDTQAMQNQGIIPHLASGTKKKKDDPLATYKEMTKSGVEKGGDLLENNYHSAKKGVDVVKDVGGDAIDATKKGASWLGDKIGDVWDYVKNPGKLVKKMMDGIGFGKENKTMEMAGLAFNSLKKSLVDKVKSWFEEAEAEGGDGDAAWLLKHDLWQKFGAYTGGLGFNGGQHFGVDFGMLPGTDVKAVAGGKVSKVWNDFGGGKSMEVDLGNGLTNWYMHLNKQLKKKGDRVGVGDLIAKSGNTGNFTAGSGHLHFQLNKNGTPQSNVLEWLKGLGGGGKKKAASKWAPDIKRAANRMNVGLKGNDLKNIISLINAESGGDSGITQGNIGDINNQRGTPAQGLLQYVPNTFKSYAMKGHKNIKSGYDQLLAFFNNKNWRSQFNPNGGWSPSGPRRFAHGGMIKKHGLYEAGEGNREEMILPLTNKVRAMQLIDQAKSFMGVDDNGSISTVDTGSSSDTLVAELMKQNNRLLEALINTVENKDLVVDKNSMVDVVNTGLGKKYRNNRYTEGG